MLSQLAAHLGLPRTHNGQVLSCLLVTSTLFSTLAVGLAAPAAGFWQMFLSLIAGSFLVIHHVTLVCLLRKHSSGAPYVHNVLTRKKNIGFLVLFEAMMISAVGVGLYFYIWLHDSTDDYYPALALVSTLFALFEAIILGILILYCLVARREKLMGAQGLDETGL
ncbi:mannosyltransferase domain protein [Ceratobasidium sp. AG-Ba]|nr:mannosyltransferase domain protein [Ceratobasidium sp. AG-Ba]